MSRKIRNIACSTYLASITCATSLFVEATINPIPASARTDRCIAVVNEINTAMNSKPSNGLRRDFPTEHSADGWKNAPYGTIPQNRAEIIAAIKESN